MVAKDADRTAAETRSFGRQNKGLHDQRRIDRGVEEPFELPFSLAVTAQFADPLEAAGVAAEHQEYRRVPDPRHVGNQRREAVALLRSLTRMTEACWKSDFEEAEKAVPSNRRSKGSGTGARHSGDGCAASGLGAATEHRGDPRRLSFFTEAGAPLGLVAHAHISSVLSGQPSPTKPCGLVPPLPRCGRGASS